MLIQKRSATGSVSTSSTSMLPPVEQLGDLVRQEAQGRETRRASAFWRRVLPCTRAIEEGIERAGDVGGRGRRRLDRVGRPGPARLRETGCGSRAGPGRWRHRALPWRYGGRFAEAVVSAQASQPLGEAAHFRSAIPDVVDTQEAGRHGCVGPSCAADQNAILCPAQPAPGSAWVARSVRSTA